MWEWLTRVKDWVAENPGKATLAVVVVGVAGAAGAAYLAPAEAAAVGGAVLAGAGYVARGFAGVANAARDAAGNILGTAADAAEGAAGAAADAGLNGIDHQAMAGALFMALPVCALGGRHVGELHGERRAERPPARPENDDVVREGEVRVEMNAQELHEFAEAMRAAQEEEGGLRHRGERAQPSGYHG